MCYDLRHIVVLRNAFIQGYSDRVLIKSGHVVIGIQHVNSHEQEAAAAVLTLVSGYNPQQILVLSLKIQLLSKGDNPGSRVDLKY